jgi:hypothetical protein
MINKWINGLAELDAPSLKTLLILSTYQDEHGKCDPRQKELAERMNISLRSVSSHIGKLLEFTTPDGSKILDGVREYANRTSEYTHLIYQLLPASCLLNKVDVVEAPTPPPNTLRLKSGSTESVGRTMEFDAEFLKELEKLEKDFTSSDRLYSTFHNNRKRL